MALGDITIKSTVLPDIVINPLTKSGGSPDVALQIARPSFDVDLGTELYHYAPWGEPSSSVSLAVIAGVLALLLIVWYIGKKMG